MTFDPYRHTIAAHFPDITIQSFALFAEGWANRLYLVNESIVFRFPLDASSEQSLLREIRLLPLLAPDLPLPVPNYQYIAPASDSYPFSFVGYPLIAGTTYPQAPLSLRRSAWWRPAVGGFISALHKIPIQKAMAAGLAGYVTAQTWRDALAAKHEPYQRHVLPLLTHSQRKAITHDLHQAVQDERMILFSPVVIHQDLDFHNILVDMEAEQVTGVIDFGSCSIGDPLLDVSPEIQPYYLGEIDPGWDFRRDYYRRISALEDLLAICTSEHNIPNSDSIRQRKLLEITGVWSAAA